MLTASIANDQSCEWRVVGHQKLGNLPRSKYWEQVVGLISDGAAAADVAAATSRAAEGSMPDVSNDPAVRFGFWLLTQIPLGGPRSRLHRRHAPARSVVQQ